MRSSGSPITSAEVEELVALAHRGVLLSDTGADDTLNDRLAAIAADAHELIPSAVTSPPGLFPMSPTGPVDPADFDPNVDYGPR